MNDEEANEKRLIANEIMRQLYEAGQVDQLRILELYARRAIAVVLEQTGKQATF